MGYTNYDKLYKAIRSDSSNRISWDLREKERRIKMENMDPQKLVDDMIRGEGRVFFKSGALLEEASEDKRNNPAFIEGYNQAKEIKDELIKKGFDDFNNGKDIPSFYRDKEDYMQGYNAAKYLSSIENAESQKGRHR